MSLDRLIMFVAVFAFWTLLSISLIVSGFSSATISSAISSTLKVCRLENPLANFIP